MDLVRSRLRNQCLARTGPRTAMEVVRELGAVQAQDYPAARWAIGLRAKGLSDSDVERAFDRGDILRTHVLRPTWHFVAPDDIRWMLSLTAPRVHAANAHTYRKYELDGAVFRRSRRVFERALRGGKSRTRSELGTFLKRANVDADGIRLAAVMMDAELERVVVSGPRKGKQFTYGLFEERAPKARTLERDAALAELAKRYFASHGPATLRDYVWWSGLTLADARRGMEALEPELEQAEVEGRTYWFVESKAPAARGSSSSAHLLPNYDEYLIAYKDRGPVAGSSGGDLFAHSLLVAGRWAGRWRRALEGRSVRVEAFPNGLLRRTDLRAIASAAERYAQFLDLPLELAIDGKDTTTKSLAARRRRPLP